jgi:subtilisin family serine protease
MARFRARLLVALFGLAVAVTPAAFADSGAEAIPEAGTYTGWTPLSLSDREVTVFVELGGQPVALAQRDAGRKLSPTEKAAIRANLRNEQAAVRPGLERAGARIVGEYQVAINGFKVQAKGTALADIAAVPGVQAIRELALIQPDHVKSMPFIGAPTAWNGAAGFRGEDITIAVIDSGIDYTHANFGGPGTPLAFQNADAADTLPPSPTLVGPLAPKVKGGVDLVGDTYNAASADPAINTPKPDPNPLDCNGGNAGGHGSHVAGSAAGFGVTDAGATYTGSYTPTTISSNAWTIGPGVAPKAWIYSIRVFGCSGSTGVTVDAIEHAVDQGVDVINMSLGSAFGSSDDASALAASNAAAAGVVVVASAGNNGPSQYITGSPATGTGTISVAANDSNDQFAAANINTAGGPITAINANGAALPAGSYPIKVLRNADGTVSLGCNEAEYAGTAGMIVVSVRGTCARVARAVFADKAGAAAAVMVNTDANFPPFEGKITANPDTGEQRNVTIPFLGVRGVLGPAATPDGDNLVAADGQTVTLTSTTLSNPGFRGFASFSSGGPRRNDSWLKPDITGPGVSIVSTGVGSGNGIRISSGTSMSGPHVAGVAALTRQAHPTWSVADIKAAIVNTADPAGVANHRISRGGSGLVQPARSTATSVVALGDPMTASLSYGWAEFTGTHTASKTVTLRNNGSSAATFSVGSESNSPFASAHTVTPGASSVTVPAGGSATVAIQLSVNAADVGNASAFREVAGQVVFTPAAGSNSGIALRVPYYLVPRALSRVRSAPPQLRFAGTETARTINVLNQDGGIAGNADFYLWGLEDGNEAAANANDIRAVGVQSFASATPTNPNRRLLVFAVNTWDRWSNAAVSEFDIPLDVNGDGGTDYIVAGADAGLLLGTGQFDGRFAVGVFSTRSAGGSVLFLATAPHDGSTALLPVRTDQLCRTGEPCLDGTTNRRISYGATGFANRPGSVDDPVAGTARYNPWSPALSEGMFVGGLAPGASSEVPLTLNRAEWASTPTKGLMIVTTDNRSGADEASLVPVTVTGG